jgi:muramoyltetrapeptide carboxypeptidase LdcA involved in peptidoglycan recycling
VAILSPASALPGEFPQVFELGLRRLRAELGLDPVEYPYTRVQGDARQRAEDLHAAFADPSIKVIMASIGGDDQITVLRHLDSDLITANPKPFFGYSDNTNLLHWLSRNGIVGYYGGSVLVHLGRGGRTNQDTMASLRAALYTEGWFDLTAPLAFGDETNDWHDPGALHHEPPVRPASGHWTWHNAERVVEGVTWGGCLEVVVRLLVADLDIPTGDELSGQVLMLETSELMPAANDVYRWLVDMGERGLLEHLGAVLMARPKAWDFEKPLTVPERDAFAAAQRDCVLSALATYNPAATVVFDVDFGHTDPQLIIPYGGQVRIDGPAGTISVRY